MSLSAKYLTAAVSAAGVSSVVGVPVALKVQSREGRSVDNVEGRKVSQISLERCSESGKKDENLIAFGSVDLGNICGKIELKDGQLNNENQYTDFFKDRGTEKIQDWSLNTSQDEWTKQCSALENSSFQGAIYDSSSSSGSQYLGLCENTDINSTKFVKKAREQINETNKEEGAFGVCYHNCGKNNTESMGTLPVALEERNLDSENGKKVQFYKQ